MTEQALLTLIATPDDEERLVDWLLQRGHTGFTTLPCSGHGVAGDRLAAAEQVAGRQSRVAFWIQLPLEDAHALVSDLHPAFGRTGMHYWIAPVHGGGPLRG
jgi:hypothetical protein